MKAIIGADFPKIVIPLIDEAKKNLDLAVYDWRWYKNQPGHAVQQFNNALVRAVGRGVYVRVLCQRGELVDFLKTLKINARRLRDKRMLHAKLIIIDNAKLVIGSHNFTRNAFSHNVEASVLVDIPEGYTRWQEFFNNLYGL